VFPSKKCARTFANDYTVKLSISAVKLSEGEWCPDRGARVGALAFDHLEISSALWSATMTALATAGLLAGQ
jgi:hypothetical protein